jgi:hypothetical protein
MGQILHNFIGHVNVTLILIGKAKGSHGWDIKQGNNIFESTILKSLSGCHVGKRLEEWCHPSPKPSSIPDWVNAFFHVLSLQFRKLLEGRDLVCFVHCCIPALSMFLINEKQYTCTAVCHFSHNTIFLYSISTQWAFQYCVRKNNLLCRED